MLQKSNSMKTFMQHKLGQIKSKLITIRENPYKVCMGYALGIFLAATPFIGLKVLIAIVLTYIFRLSKVAAIIGVLHVNLFTAPLFYGLTYFIGNAVMGNHTGLSSLSVGGLMELPSLSLGVFVSLLTGGVIIGLPWAFISYLYSYRLIKRRKPVKAGDPEKGTNEAVYTVITGHYA